MTDVIMARIEAINNGELPEGYKRAKAGIMPEDWDGAIRAKQLFKSHTDKKHNGDLEILASTQERGIVPRSQIGIDIQCSDEGVKGYKKVSKGDFVISLRSFQGGIEYSEYDGIVSPAYTILKPINDISAGFYRNYFKTDSFIDRINGAVYGIRDGKQIGYEDFGDMYVHCPPLAEQERIAEILLQCDKVIELCEKKLVETKKLKKTCLRWMFPENGDKAPKLRFSGYTNNWELSKIGLHARVLSAARVHKHEWTPTGIPFFRSSDVVSAYKGTTNEKAFISIELYEELIKTSGELEEGDILVTGGGSIGIPYIVPDNTPLYSKDADLIWIKKSKDVDSMYLFSYLESAIFRKYIESISHVGTIAHYTIEQVKATPIALPSHDEQVRIGDFFQKLNSLIELYDRELNEHKMHKKATLQLLLTGIVRTKV
mgnify:CR=1 FL=1